MTDSDDWVYFTMSGRDFAFDTQADKLTGDELIEIETRTGLSMMGWFQRLQDAQKLTASDICLLGFLAAKRTNPALQWDPFVRGIHPLTFRWTDAPAEPSPPPRSSSRKAPAKG